MVYLTPESVARTPNQFTPNHLKWICNKPRGSSFMLNRWEVHSYSTILSLLSLSPVSQMWDLHSKVNRDEIWLGNLYIFEGFSVHVLAAFYYHFAAALSASKWSQTHSCIQKLLRRSFCLVKNPTQNPPSLHNFLDSSLWDWVIKESKLRSFTKKRTKNNIEVINRQEVGRKEAVSGEVYGHDRSKS